MWVMVDGISIKLNAQQITKVKAAKIKLEGACKSFEGVLRRFGFKLYTEWEGDYKPKDKCYQHPDRWWWAEIRVHNEHWIDCWVVGHSLKSGGFPGGWIYETPEELKTALLTGLKRYALSTD